VLVEICHMNEQDICSKSWFSGRHSVTEEGGQNSKEGEALSLIACLSGSQEAAGSSRRAALGVTCWALEGKCLEESQTWSKVRSALM
jgi:hypothetical protein